MAAVAGRVDDLAGRRQAVEVLGIPDLDAVVHPRQEAVEDALRDAHERVRVVRGDLERVPAGDEQAVAPRALGVADLLAHGLPHCARAQHLRDDRAPPRQVRPERVHAHVPELGAHVLQQPSRAARRRRARPQRSPGSGAARRNRISVLRPLKTIDSSRRNGPTNAQFSENSRPSQDFSRCGARPQ